MSQCRAGFLQSLSIGASLLLAALPQFVLGQPAMRPVDDRPNIVLVLVDDLGWTDVGAFGSTFYETPNIDRLAREGMRFTDAYASAPVCSPSRAAILTGKYPARLRQTDWIPGRENHPAQRLMQVDDLNHLPLEQVTIAEALKEAGYATASIGKWHLGDGPYLPEHQGFDVNVAGNNWGSPPSHFHPYGSGSHSFPELAAKGEPGEELSERLAEEAAAFIGSHRDRPFFLYVPLYAVHIPLQAEPEQVARYQWKADNNPLPDSAAFTYDGGHIVRQVQNHPVYAGLVETMDAAVGRILAAVEENGLSDRTVIVFTSDNGGLATAEGRPTSNLPLRMGKGFLYEGGIREPAIIRWLGTVQPGSVNRTMISGIDFFPTFMEIAGLPIPEDLTIDGVSLMPVLQGGPLSRDTLFWHYPHYSNQGGSPSGAVRAGDYKLIEFFEDGRLELYDLAEDVGERRDLAPERPEKAAELAARLRSWRAAVQVQMPVPNPDYTGPSSSNH